MSPGLRTATTGPDPRRQLGELARTVRRHRGLLAAGLTAGAVATALPVLAPTPPPTVQVLAAGHDLVAGSALTPSDVTSISLPRAVAPTGSLTSASSVIGRVVAGPVRKGEALTDVRLLGSGLLPTGAGQVAVPVRLADAGTATLLRAGDRVDVLGAPTAGGGAATVLAHALPVLAVPDTEQSSEGALVVLAATPSVAARLATAAIGDRLSVTLLAA